MAIDPTGTIGSKPCEVALNKILFDLDATYPKLFNKINNILHKSKFAFKELLAIKDDGVFNSALKLLKERYDQSIKDVSRCKPTNIKTHALCCINAYYHITIASRTEK